MVADMGAEQEGASRLAEVYVRSAPAGFRLAYLLTGDRALAEDLVQEAFLRFVGRLHHLRDPEAFDAYLRRTIVNLSKDTFRRRAVERSYLERRTAELRDGHTDRDVAAYESMRAALLSLPAAAASGDRPALLRRSPRVRDRRPAALPSGNGALARRARARSPPPDPRGDDMTDQDVRDFLDRMAAEEPVQFLDAEPLTRRARRRAARTAVVGALGVAAAIAVVFAGASQLRDESPRVPVNPPEERQVDLGIFEPVAGRIVYYSDSSLWAVDPSAPSPVSTPVRLEPGGTADADGQFAANTLPLGWSSDGTELLFLRNDQTSESWSQAYYLYILHADGTETQVTPQPVWGASISPDGSRVVFADDRDNSLYVVDAEGGQPVRIAEGEEPTFSPDGTQIAYLTLPRTVRGVQGEGEHVWVANADGTDAHEILADEPALAEGVFDLTWSPAGDRIAMENSLEGHVAIYSFAPDGSNFTEVITGGFNPHWSPDGSQIAYGWPGRDGVSIADADGSNVQVFDFGASGPWHPGAAGSPVSEDAPAAPSRVRGRVGRDRDPPRH